MVGLALLAGLAAPSFGGKSKPKSRGDLINVFLSPRLAQWLVGPIAHIAGEQLIQEYLALTDDAAADAFIDEFWRERANSTKSPWPGRQARDIFERRAKEADRLFTEGTNLGRATDRGEFLVLYGSPARRGYGVDRGRRDATIEIWRYSSDSAAGLDGSKPPVQAFFIKEGDLTVRYHPRKTPELLDLNRVP